MNRRIHVRLNERRGRGACRPTVRRGYTLIELIVCIAVGVVISGSAGMILWNASSQRVELSARAELHEIAAAALEKIVRHVREVEQDECPGNPTPCLLGNAQVSTATATELRFGSNGLRQTGSTLEMTIDNGTSWHVLVRDVSSFALAYANRLGSAMTSFPLSQANREDIRQVQITLALTRGTQTANVRTAVYLRNFMNEVMSDP